MEMTPLDQYKETGANMWHYGTHFASFLGLFLAFTGGLLLVLFRDMPSESSTAMLSSKELEEFGLAMTFVFWVTIESSHYLCGHFLK